MIARRDTDLLPVIFIGESDATAVRRTAAGGSGAAPVGPGTVCFVALSVGEAAEEAKRLARLGCHVFLDVPKLPSVRDLEQLSHVAEEAGVSVAVSRPLRFAPGAAEWTGRSSITVIEAEFGAAPESWQRGLSEALDLCTHMCRSATTRNIEVSVERADRLWPVFAAASLRFDNGTLAILSLRRSAAPEPMRCMATVGTEVRQLRLSTTADAYASETRAFLQAIARGERAPVSASEALAGARLQDQVLALLR